MTILSKLRAIVRRRRTELSWALRLKLPPWRRSSLDVWSVAGGLGDELMALSVVQEAARRVPSCRLTYYARHTALMPTPSDGLRILPYDRGSLPKDGIGLTYMARHRLPIVEQMAAQLGLHSSPHTITLPLMRSEHLPFACSGDRPVILIQTVASLWTPNKQWPAEHWMDLINSLPENLRIVEAGTETVLTKPPNHPGYVSLVGETTLEQFASCVQHASVFVGPPSGGMHLAHAYQIPSVIVLGGYESKYPYPLAQQFYNAVPCAPCWLRTPCPHDRRCLREIEPSRVREAILAALHTRKPK